jgi:peptidoglycan/LPS O-acetylase OafA/YrhL
MKYRREIDGLRALAIIPVVLYHAGFAAISGGFIGVDVFFVISGFLITGIIYSDLENNDFSIKKFYERRARRILPALFFMAFVCTIFAWVYFSRTDLSDFSKSLFATFSFSSNFYFWKDVNYFSVGAEMRPLIHTWSLSVEEQYYILFPILLIVAWRLGRKKIIPIISIIALLSFFLAFREASRSPETNFFLLPFRAWELFVGAFAFLISDSMQKNEEKLFTYNVLSSCGLVLIVTSIFIFNKATPWPSAFTLVPTLGTALILLCGTQKTWVGNVLRESIFVGLGLISYSVYLWHQPIISFARYLEPSIGHVAIFLLIILSLMISAFSWKFIETPFRDRNKISGKCIFVFSLIGISTFVFLGLTTSFAFGRENGFGDEAILARYLALHDQVYFISGMDERLFIKNRIDSLDFKPYYIEVGSSRIMQLSEDMVGKPSLNVAVSGATLRDDIAITYLALDKIKPRVILLGIDPWLLNKSNGDVRWESLAKDYMVARGKLNLQDDVIGASASPVLTHKCDFSLCFVYDAFYKNINRTRLIPINNLPEIKDKIGHDGRHIYNIVYSNNNQQKIKDGFKDLENYSNLQKYSQSNVLLRMFNVFLSYTTKKSKVVLVLSPYHPDFYRKMLQDDINLVAIENTFREIAKAHGLRVIGSYNPDKYHCTSNEFYDGMHPKEICMAKIVNDLR